jgi:DNA-binding NarL/FixJ family response regulator
MKPITVAIVDDHRLLRAGLISIIQKMKGVSVVGQMSTGEEAVNFASSQKPDVFLIDIMMTGMTGIEATRWIKEQVPSIKIILISSQVSREYISDGIKCGIDGYLDKDVDKATLLTAIQTVMRGEKYFSPQITALIVDEFYVKQKDTKPVLTGKHTNVLSKREEEVLILIAHGKKLKEIADELFISVKTVESHKLHIQDKLNLFTIAQLVKYAIANKLLTV